MKRHALLTLLVFIFLFHGAPAQTILNGDFENNSSVINQINLTHAAYNTQMANSFSFGSYGDMDIITDAAYCGLPQHGSWYIAFTGGGTDAISLTLSAPLVAGNSYTISFYDRGCTGYGTSSPFRFSLSMVNNAEGAVIYTEPSASPMGTWTLRTFTFAAPNNGQYLTMLNTTGGTSTAWTHLDNVQFVTAGIPPAVSKFLASDSVLCQYDCIDFTDMSSNNPTSWQWTFPGGAVSSSTLKNPANICYLTAGTFPVTLHAANANGGDTVTITNYITVSAAPPVPSITQHHDTLTCSTHSSYTSYQWYADTTLLAGAMDTLLVVSKGGNYNVRVTNESGCSIAVGINIVLSAGQYPEGQESVVIAPNPAGNELTVSGLSFTQEAAISIYSVLGSLVYTMPVAAGHAPSLTVDIAAFPPAVYFLRLETENGVLIKKFIKQ